MKSILILTDFSKNAASAAEAGLMLSGKLHTDILLFNSYIDYSTMASYSGGAWIVDEYKERQKQSKLGLDTLIEGLESLVGELDPGDRKPAIYSESDDNDLGMDVAEMLKQKDIELVVMGARSGCDADVLYGYDTSSVIKNSTKPIFVIPAKTNLKQIRKIIFATDFGVADIEAIQYLVKLCKLFDYQIDIVHVTDGSKAEDAKIKNKVIFENDLSKIHYPGLSYQIISGKDVAQELAHVVEKEGAAVLALLHHQYSFFNRLFRHSDTKAVLAHHHIPLIVFPSKQ